MARYSLFVLKVPLNTNQPTVCVHFINRSLVVVVPKEYQVQLCIAVFTFSVCSSTMSNDCFV